MRQKPNQQYNNRTIQQLKPAFTLIEVLVSITIIAILIAAASISTANASKKARDATRKVDIVAIGNAIETYRQITGQIPTEAATNRIRCGSSTAIDWGTTFVCDPDGLGEIPTTTFMQKLPKDPTASPNYAYQVIGTTYTLSAKLENASDADIQIGAVVSPPGTCTLGTHNYCIKSIF